jgi:RNA polymerase sigma-70 factor (ECF subfamily)
MATDDRERELRRGVLAGDEAAWRALYDGAFDPLAGYVAWRCAGLRDLADEVVQETWLVAVRRIRAFDPAAGSFVAWLRGIAANVVRNRLRQRRREPVRPLAGDVPADDDAGRRERAEQIAVALTSLPARYEAVLRAKYLDQQGVAEIAAAWGESAKAVESLLTRARLAFRAAYLCEEGTESMLHESEP